MDNPPSGIVRGWHEIRKVYERIFSAPGRVEVEFHDYTLHVIGDVFYAVGGRTAFATDSIVYFN